MGRLDITDNRDVVTTHTCLCKMEQRPAPCCRVSSYCTDLVYTGDDDYHETTTDIDDRRRCRYDSILLDFLLAPCPFSLLQKSSAPRRVQCKDVSIPFSLSSYFVHLTQSRRRSSHEAICRQVLVVVDEVTFSQCIMFRCQRDNIYSYNRLLTQQLMNTT